MKSILFLTALLLAAGCQNSDQGIESEVIKSRVRVVSNLAVDGCTWHFEVANADSSTIAFYLPTVASEPKIKALVSKWGTEDAYFFTEVNLSYRVTSQTRTLECGFGRKSEVKTIEIDEVSRGE